MCASQIAKVTHMTRGRMQQRWWIQAPQDIALLCSWFVGIPKSKTETRQAFHIPTPNLFLNLKQMVSLEKIKEINAVQHFYLNYCISIYF